MNGDNKAPISCWYSYAQYCEVVSATMNTFFKTVNIIADVFIFFRKISTNLHMLYIILKKKFFFFFNFEAKNLVGTYVLTFSLSKCSFWPFDIQYKV